MYHSFDFGVVQARGGKDDAMNNIAAGAATGTLFRATCEFLASDFALSQAGPSLFFGGRKAR
jgi:hypothetical protein